MNDRYLYRAKRTDNGEWVEGYLSYPFCTKKGNESYYFYAKDSLGFFCRCVVDASTICQCTGLKDRNGKLIWENDVVRVTINGGSTICRCAFADTVAQFQLWQEHTIKRTSTVLNLGNYECEVIGNIFDNPELLKSEG